MDREENQNVLYIRMLGGFQMSYREQPVLLSKSLSSKMLHLLLILVYSGGEGISRERLLEQLYADSDMQQASNSLRAIVYRLRKGLVAAGLPEGEYIVTKGGVYRWHTEQVEVELDAEEFQKKAVAALEEPDTMRKSMLLEEACRMYRGEFLPLMIAEDWVSAANWKYQELYFKCLRELTLVLKEQHSYQKLLMYCEQALAKYPYEEWQLVKLDCLTAMKEYKKALEYYEQVTEDFQREFGMLPSEQMMQRHRAIKNRIQFEANNIDEIQDHLHGDSDMPGATKCDYLTFVDIYRYIVRVLARNGVNAYLVLFTLVDKEGVPIEASGILEEARQTLEKSIHMSLRKSDLYTRCGKNQFLLLITSNGGEGCESACSRIGSRFHGLNRRKKVSLYYTYKPALEMTDDRIKDHVGRGLKDWNT